MQRVPSNQSGVMLIEALVGMLIFMIGIVALIGLQGAAISATTDAKYRSDAAFLASQVVTQMWVDKNNISTYTTGSGTNPERTRWEEEVARNLPNGQGQIRVVPNSGGFDITVEVNWRKGGDQQRRYISTARIDFNS